MSLKLTFSKVSILSFSRTPAQGTIKLSCAPSKLVLKRMAWADFPEQFKSGRPDGKLSASVITFTPSDSTRSKNSFDLNPAGAVYSFEFVRTQVKKGKNANKTPSYRLELHCSVDFTDEAGAQKLEQYMHSVAESTMQVTYEPEPVQQEFEGVELTEEQMRATTAEAD